MLILVTLGPPSALRTQLRADDWRAKKEGLDAVAECLKRANHRIAPNVGDLCAALKPSLINNNKALVLGMGRLAIWVRDGREGGLGRVANTKAEYVSNRQSFQSNSSQYLFYLIF